MKIILMLVIFSAFLAHGSVPTDEGSLVTSFERCEASSEFPPEVEHVYSWQVSKYAVPEYVLKTVSGITLLLASEIMPGYIRDELGIRNYFTEHGSNFTVGIAALTGFFAVSRPYLQGFIDRYPVLYTAAWMLGAFLFNLRIEYKPLLATYDYHDVFTGTLAILVAPSFQRVLEKLTRTLVDRRDRHIARELAREAQIAAAEFKSGNE